MKRKLLVGAVILIVIVAAAGLVLTDKGQKVYAVKAEKNDISQNVEEIGYVQSADTARLQSQTNGKVVQVNVQAGDRVVQGQQLVIIENVDLKLSIESAESQLAQAQTALAAAQISLRSANQELAAAQRDLQRKEQLQQAGALPQAEYDEAMARVLNLQQMAASQQVYAGTVQAQVENSRQLLAQMKTKQNELIISSPMDGVVFELPARAGDMVIPGQVLLQVGKADQLEIKTDLLSDDLRNVAVGQKVKISAPLLGDRVIQGRVEKIRPQAFTKVSALGVEQRRVEVIVSMEETGKLQPGYEVKTVIETSRKENILAIPRESLRSRSDGNYEVLIVKDGKINYQKVKVGIVTSENVEILEGLTEGDLVVQDAGMDLQDGQKVQAQLVKD